MGGGLAGGRLKPEGVETVRADESGDGVGDGRGDDILPIARRERLEDTRKCRERNDEKKIVQDEEVQSIYTSKNIEANEMLSFHLIFGICHCYALCRQVPKHRGSFIDSKSGKSQKGYMLHDNILKGCSQLSPKGERPLCLELPVNSLFLCAADHFLRKMHFLSAALCSVGCVLRFVSL